MMFLRGDIWRAVAINRLQAPTLPSLRDSITAGEGMMFLRGDIWRAVAINRLQAPTLPSLRDSRPAKTKASV